MQTIGTRIAQQRSALGYTPAQLAAKLRIREATILFWESGDGTPEIALLPELCKVLQVSPAYLVDGKVPQAMMPETATEEIEQQEEELRYVRKQLNLGSILSLSLSALALLSAIAIQALWQKSPLSFLVGGALSVAGLLCALPFMISAAKHSATKKGVLLRAELLISVFIMVFSALLPLGIVSVSTASLSGTDWFFHGGIYVVITGLFCAASAAVINLSAGWWTRSDLQDPLTQLKLRRTALPVLLLLVSFCIHMIVYNHINDNSLGSGMEFTAWDAFAEYMQQPLSADGESELKLIKIEPVDDNLHYHFTDSEGNNILVENAVSTVVSKKTKEVLCTYLNLNRFVYQVTFSDSGSKLPVTVFTNADYHSAHSRITTVHHGFLAVYLLEILLIFPFYRRQKFLQEAIAKETMHS